MKSKPIARNRRTVPEEPPAGWTFFTNHAHVLFAIAADPEARLRDLAERVGITERAVQRILADLQVEKYVTVTKVGRRNRYKVNPRPPLRHPIERHRSVKALLEFVEGNGR
ncbi:MAG: MarR family transcriptional regulator [Acidobacteriota bacterium]